MITVASSRRTRRVLSGPLTWLAISLIWLALLPRIVPVPRADRGIFVSVAERLIAGDVLYRDVWDNKDPLFSLVLQSFGLYRPTGTY